MRKMITIAVMLAMTIMLLAPQAAYAVSPPPPNLWYGTMQIEYRFAEGQPFNVPQQISRFGYTYNLVSQTAPVLESEMPLTRTYSYRVEGYLDEYQLETIKGDPNITVTPVLVPAEKEVDKIDVLNKKTNDVDRIDQEKEFYLVVDFEEDGTPIKELVMLNRTGLSFEVGPLDEDGLPTGYIATVIYRGVELELIHGYYQVNETFTSSFESDVPIYVIVADYRTDEMPPPIQTTLAGAGGGAAGAGPGETTPEGLTAIEDERVALQAGEGPADLPGIVQDINDGLVPQGNAGVTGVWSLLSMILCAAGIIVVGLSILASAVAKRRSESASDNTSLLNNRSFLLRILTVVVAAFTILTWVLLDDFTRGTVWVNENTIIVAILFTATIAVSVIASLYEKRVNNQIVKEEEEDGLTANAG